MPDRTPPSKTSGSPEVEYDGFLSYSHVDARFARRVQAFCQRYALPDRRRLKIYLDASDIRSGSLDRELSGALATSKTLVVCCSPATPSSTWIKREIEAFDHRRTGREAVPIVIAGDPASVAPRALSECRHLDLRRGWWLGMLSPGARVELARGVATIAGLPMRDVVNWERKRQRRLAAALAVLLLVTGVVVALFPLRYTREIDLRPLTGTIRAVEFADLDDHGKLLIAAREVSEGSQGTRNYVAYYPDALASRDWKWLGVDDSFTWTRRLLYLRFVRPPSDPNLSRLADAARAASAARIKDAGGDVDSKLLAPRGPWAAEPVAGLVVALAIIPPIRSLALDATYESPPNGDAVVATFKDAGAPLLSTIPGFDPGERRRVDPRAVDLRQGIPVAAGAELWLGVAAKPDGSRGGLWRSADSGKTWQRVERFASVNAIAIDPRDPARVLVATAPGPIKSGIRELTVDTSLWERRGADGAWTPLDHVPPFSPTSHVRFAGFFDDGALLVQVDSKLFVLGRDNLARRYWSSTPRDVPASAAGK